MQAFFFASENLSNYTDFVGAELAPTGHVAFCDLPVDIEKV
jgi:hypothetical protein